MLILSAIVSFMLSLMFYGDVAFIILSMSLTAKVGCYIVYGKQGGALPLPKIQHIREREAREKAERSK